MMSLDSRDGCYAVRLCICSLSSQFLKQKIRPPMVSCTSSPMVDAQPHRGRSHLADEFVTWSKHPPREVGGMRRAERSPAAFRIMSKFPSHLKGTIESNGFIGCFHPWMPLFCWRQKARTVTSPMHLVRAARHVETFLREP